MIIIQNPVPERYTGNCEVGGQRDDNNIYKEIAKSLRTKQLPLGKEVKINRDCYLYIGKTIFKVWFNGTSYRFINLSNHSQFWVDGGQEKIIGRNGEVLVEINNQEATEGFLKVRVDNEGNLFFCDVSINGTFIDAENQLKEKDNMIICEKITCEEIMELEDSKKTLEAKYFYEKDKKYRPINKINLGSGRILYITDRLVRQKDKLFGYGVGGYHERIIGYIRIGENLQLRMFYKSKSEGVWRSCPGERKDGGYSKGESLHNYSYDTTTKVEPKLSTIYESIDIKECLIRSEDPIGETAKLGDLLLENDMKEEIQVDSLFQSDELMNYLIKKLGMYISSHHISDIDRKKLNQMIQYYINLKQNNAVLASAGEIMHTEINGYKESIPFYVVKDIFDGLIPLGLNYECMHKIEGNSYQYQHIDFGMINVNVYEAIRNGKRIKIHFGSAKHNHPEKIWIDNITYFNNEISTFGTYKNSINAAPLVTKPADYEEQSPGFGDKRIAFRLLSGNMDIRDLYQDNPIIEQYKRMEGLLSV